MCIRDRVKAELVKNNEWIQKNSEETRAEFKEFKEQLTTKLEETNTRIEYETILETRVEQSLNEHAIKIENRFKDQKTEWLKELKESIKQLAEHWKDVYKRQVHLW